jgi:hypothetical protein
MKKKKEKRKSPRFSSNKRGERRKILQLQNSFLM